MADSTPAAALELGHTPNASLSTSKKNSKKVTGANENSKKRTKAKATIRKLAPSQMPEIFTQAEESLTEEQMTEMEAQLTRGLDPEMAAELASRLQANIVKFQEGYDFYLKELFRLQIEESVLRNVKIVIGTEHEALRAEEDKLAK